MTAPIPTIQHSIELLDTAIAALGSHGATLSATADLAVIAHKLRRVVAQLPAQIANGRADACVSCRYYGASVTHTPYGDRDSYRLGSNCSATTPDHCPIVRACRGEE